MKNSIASFSWQFLSNLIGFILKLILNKRIVEVRSTNIANIYIVSGKFNGVSLGSYIFLNEKYPDIETVIKHELGHTRQSMMLGPLYLFVVGIPSASMNLMTRWGWLKPENYYKRWPENWADRLGGVDR